MKYRIEAPDGRKFEIEAPDDASDDELRQAASSFLGDGSLSDVGVRRNAPVYEDPESSLIADVGAGVAELGSGILEGGANVLDHAADWAQSGLNLLGGAGDKLNSLWGDGENDLSSAVPEARAGLETVRGIGRLGGEIVASAPLGMLRGGAFVQGTAGGALLSDASDPLGVAADAAFGGVGGKLTELGLNAAARVANPRVSQDVRTLIDNGVAPTTGQVAGSPVVGRTPGQLKRFEDVAASVPIAGAAVRNAQGRGVESLNRVATQRALTPIGERLPASVEAGHAAITHAGDRLSAAYNDVLPRLQGQADQAFATRVRTVVRRADLPPGYEAQSQSVVNEALKAFRPHNPATGNTTPVTLEQMAQLPPTQWRYNGRRLRDASERLGDLSSGFRASDDPYMRILGDVAGQLRDQLHALARRGNPQQAQRLRDIDRGYASLVRVERAARGTNDGMFTARQYDSAVRGADRSARRRQSARGQALDQDLSGAASRVMGDTAAHGGSKDVNSLVALGLLGTRAISGDPLAALGIGAVGAGSAAYTGRGQDALRALLTRQAGPTSTQIETLLRRGARAAPIVAPAAIENARQ